MKKYLFFSLLSLLFVVAFSDEAHAQKKKKKSSKTDEYFDEGGFVNKLWYGGSFALGFSGSNDVNTFTFGITPMVGYKVVGDIVSVGPRVGFLYNNVRVKVAPGEVLKVNPLSYTLGVFARVKPFANFFGHFEYEYENEDSIDPDEDGFIEYDQNGDIYTDRIPRDNVYLGIGYTSGGLWGYEILLLYNVNLPSNSFDTPLDIRFGITHKF